MITIPTLSELYTSVKSDLEAELTISIPLVGKSFIRALAAVQAGKLYLLYLSLGLVQKNIFPDTADPAAQGGTLDRFGQVKLNRARFSAVAGQYKVQATGTTGATIPAETTWKSDDDSDNPGFIFVLDNEYTLDGTNQFIIRALTAGNDSALTVGNTLSLTSPVALVDTQVSILSVEIEAQAAETIAEYREKIVEAFRLEAQGGSPADYRLWAAEVQGVAEVYPYATSAAPFETTLYVEATEGDSTDGKGTPTTTILEGVESAIEDPTTLRPARKPIGAWVNYEPVTVLDIDITIDSYGDYTAEKAAAILTGLTNLIDSIRPFIGGIDVVADKNDILDTNLIIAKILEAVPGSDFGTITLEVNTVGVGTYTFTNGEIPYLASVSYT